MSWTAFTVSHGNSTRVLPHLARNARATIKALPGDLPVEFDGGMLTYGEERGLRTMLDRVIAQGREWVYIDNGYFKWGHFAGFYRVTHNAYMRTGAERGSERRWKRLGLTVRPWQRGGSFILVCPPPARFAALRGFDEQAWLDQTIATLRAHTDREIVIREKPRKRECRANPIQKAVKGAHALVCHSSNAAVEVLVEGCPVFCTDPCAASLMGESDLAKIETPAYPDGREAWAHSLAAGQWTIDEMRDGTCWRELMQ
jgi:hypothetical protein